MSYKLVKRLAQKGKRIFTTDEAREIGREIGLNPDTIIDRLYDLHKKEMIERLMKGLYSLSPELLKGIPIHEYEIGLALADSSCIAYLSAYSYHKLTDQISSMVYVMALDDPKKTFSKNLYRIRGIRYRIVRVKSEYFFGVEKGWVGQTYLSVTDLERTLVAGLIKPKYCGGFREVLDAYAQAIDRIDIPKIISYAQKISDAACKRLGWVLEQLDVKDEQLKPLLKRSTTSYSKLNPSGLQKGPWNKKWLLQENL